MMKKLKSIAASTWAWAKSKPKQSVPVVIVLLVIVGMGVRHLTRPAVVQSSFYTVKRGDFLISIVEGGTLKAVNEITVRNEMEGSSRIISIVPEGTSVKKGELLVEMDSSDLRDRLNAHEVVVQNSRFAFVQAKEALSIQKSVIESNIKEAELKVDFATSDLEKYKEGDWPQLRKNTQTKITIAEEELKRAKDKLEGTGRLQEKGYVTRTELEADQLTVQRKEIECEQTKEELRLLTKYDYPKRIRYLESLLDQAQKDLSRLKQRSAAQVAQYEADLNTRNNTLELNELRLTQLKEQLVLTKIFAPQDGLVIYASSSSPGSGILIEEGAAVRQRQDIIKLPDIAQMMVEIRVHESHVQKIRQDLSAYVTIDSIPNRQFKGSIRKVAVLPDSNSRFYNPNLKVYTTEVLIEDEIPDLKPGISGRAEVIITNLTGVLTVPIQAVTSVKGQQVCFVDNGNGRQKVPVEVGLYNDRMIEIKAGLREGDRVLLSAQADGDDIDLSGAIVNPEDAEEAVKAANKRAEESAKNAKKKKVEPLKEKPHVNPYLTDPNTSKSSRPDKPQKPTRTKP